MIVTQLLSPHLNGFEQIYYNSYFAFECVYYLILTCHNFLRLCFKRKEKCSFLGVQWKTALYWSWAGSEFAKDKTAN